MVMVMVTDMDMAATRTRSTEQDPKFPISKRRLAGVIVGTLGLTVIAFCQALSGITVNKAPTVAMRFWPLSGPAMAAQADHLMATAPDQNLERATQLARKSIAAEGPSARAIRILALTTPERAPALITIAQRLSRRELGAQLWSIEDRVDANDIAGALRHYDLALRTNNGIRQTLFARLRPALANSEIRSGMVPYLRRDAPWMLDFIYSGVMETASTRSIAQLAIEAGGLPPAKPYRALEPEILTRLVGRTGDVPLAAQFLRVIKGVPANQDTNLAFSTSDVAARYGAFGWVGSNASGAGSEFVADGKRITLRAFSLPDESGVVASRIVLLRPGQYRFSSEQTIQTSGSGSAARWSMSCRHQAVDRVVWTSSALRQGTTQTRALIDVPSDCPLQIVRLNLAGPQNDGQLDVTVKAINLVPAT